MQDIILVKFLSPIGSLCWGYLLEHVLNEKYDFLKEYARGLRSSESLDYVKSLNR